MKRRFTAEWDDDSRSWIISEITGFSAIGIFRKAIGDDEHWNLDVFQS